MTLWQVVDALPRLIPFTKAGVEKLFSVHLAETDYTGNDVFQFYKSNPVQLPDGVVISNIDLRIRRKVGHPGFLSLSLESACVNLDQVRRRFGPLEITEIPRGHSLNEKTYHTARLPWGELSFGFAERNPDCLASIVFDPKKPD